MVGKTSAKKQRRIRRLEGKTYHISTYERYHDTTAAALRRLHLTETIPSHPRARGVPLTNYLRFTAKKERTEGMVALEIVLAGKCCQTKGHCNFWNQMPPPRVWCREVGSVFRLTWKGCTRCDGPKTGGTTSIHPRFPDTYATKFSTKTTISNSLQTHSQRAEGREQTRQETLSP